MASGRVGCSPRCVTPRATRAVGTQRWIAHGLRGGRRRRGGLRPAVHARAFLVAAAFLGFAAQASKICVDTLLQESVEDDYRGRVFSFYDTTFNASFVSAAGAAAVLLPDDGKSYLVIALVAVGYALTALVYGTASARRAASEPPEPVIVR